METKKHNRTQYNKEFDEIIEVLLRTYLHKHVVTNYGTKRSIYVDNVGFPTNKDFIPMVNEKGETKYQTIE